MVNQFLDWAQQQQDVWIVSHEQLLDWVRHPVPASELNNLDSFKCSTPAVDASQKICNGIPQNENGLLNHCAFSDFPFFTCVSPSRSFTASVLTRWCTVRLPRGTADSQQPQPSPGDRGRHTGTIPEYVSNTDTSVDVVLTHE